jgi:hypothetical protein
LEIRFFAPAFGGGGLIYNIWGVHTTYTVDSALIKPPYTLMSIGVVACYDFLLELLLFGNWIFQPNI